MDALDFDVIPGLVHAEGEDELTEFQCFPKLLSDDGDESDRQLSERVTADLVQTNIIAEKEIAREHRDECRVIEIHHAHRQEIMKEAKKMGWKVKKKKIGKILQYIVRG